MESKHSSHRMQEKRKKGAKKDRTYKISCDMIDLNSVASIIILCIN